MFYNVENLFDTKNDPDHADEDFLPNGSMKWQSWKYWEKLKNISRVVTAIGQMQSPALVGLCEIENDSVIFDLTRRSPLRAQQYEYVVTNSPDPRGIDVALLYQRDQFRLIRKFEYQIPFREKNKTSRNILHVVGQLVNKDTLDVFVCHFPSRGGGQLATETSRIDAALLLKCKTDSLFHVRKNANIVIMGDFNDHPDDKSLSQALNAQSIKKEIDDLKLYNLFRHRIDEKGFGTYKYQGRWEILDQFIVSGNFLHSGPVEVKNNCAYVFNADFLLEKDEHYGGKRPFRTNLGPRYIGGFSDHLPVYVDLAIRAE
jgi:endonuclease/exonuclease/phosphatase family metal-dependent hydrolase